MFPNPIAEPAAAMMKPNLVAQLSLAFCSPCGILRLPPFLFF